MIVPEWEISDSFERPLHDNNSHGHIMQVANNLITHQ